MSPERLLVPVQSAEVGYGYRDYNRAATVDPDGDGREGVLFTNHYDAAYAPPLAHSAGLDWANFKELPTFSSTVISPAGDLDGDGRTGFVLTPYKGAASLLWGRSDLFDRPLVGDLPIQSAGTFAAGVPPPGHFGDLDGDGRDDAPFLPGFFGWAVISADAGRALALRTVPFNQNHYPAGRQVFHTSNLGDLDGDGLDEMAATSWWPAQVEIRYGGRAWTHIPDVTLLPSDAAAVGAYSATAGDFNGDGYRDVAVLWTQRAPRLDVYFGGPAGLDAEADFTLPLSDGDAGRADRFSSAEYVGDLNSDGFDDLSLGGPDGGNEIYLLPGGADLGTQALLPLSVAPVARRFYDISRAIGDFNEDGFDDFALGLRGRANANGTRGGVYLCFGNQEMVFDAPDLILEPQRSDESVTISSFSSSMAAADFSGDGAPDVAVTAVSFGRQPLGTDAGLAAPGVQVFFGGQTADTAPDQFIYLPAGIFGVESANEYLKSAYARLAGVPDLDGDGKDEMLVASGPLYTNAALFAGTAEAGCHKNVWVAWRKA